MRIIPLKKAKKLENANTSIEQIITPVRSVSNNGFSSVGKFPSRKLDRLVDYESTLENDLAEILEFDSNVEHFVEQPLQIPYRDEKGTDRIYIPDFLVTYKRRLSPSRWFPPVIYEVKYMADIRSNFDELKYKFRGAYKFAKERKWQFRIMTERHIRTEYLENAKFLMRFKYQEIDPGLRTTILDTLEFLKDGTPMEIIATASSSETRRAELLFALWHLVANEEVGCNLNDHLDVNSILWYKIPSMFYFKKP
jgi:hypothetical protein